MSSIEEQMAIESAFSKRKVLKELSAEIGINLFDEVKVNLASKVNGYLTGDYWESKQDYITAICMDDCVSTGDIVDNIILLAMKYKRTTVQNVANELGNLFNTIDDPFIKVQIGADLLDACKDIVYQLDRQDGPFMFNTFIELDTHLTGKMNLTMYLPPMVVKPLPVKNNYQSGYLMHNDSVILGNVYSNHDKPVRLDVLNILNKIGFVLDDEVLKTEKEVPKEQPVGQDLDNYNQYLIEKGALVRMYKNKTFYLNHRLDSRQRIYCQGYHISYQSSEYNKALISLAKHEVCK